MLKDHEAGLPRRIRRALISSRRGVVKKREPFGRIKAIKIEEMVCPFTGGREEHKDRIVYRHHTRGVMSRRITDHLLFGLMT